MSQFEYIAVLVSVVTGLGIVHLLTGIARFVTTRDQWKPYWLHLLWTWNVFHFLVFFWWFLWRWTVVSDWQLAVYLFILIYGMGLYLLCPILYPPVGDGEVDFKEIFYENRKSFFALWAVLMIIDFIDTNLKISYGLSSLGPFYYVANTSLFVGSLVSARTANEKWHIAWAWIFFGFMAAIEWQSFGTLRSG